MFAFLLANMVIFFSFNATAQDKEVKGFVDTKRNFNNKDSGWIKGGFINSNFTNVGLSNWAAGGQSSVSLSLIGNGFIRYTDHQNSWEMFIDAAWGTLRNGRANLPDGSPNRFFKNEDRCIILSKYGRRLNTTIHFSSLFELKSQFFPGYLPFNQASGNRGLHISNFMTPAFGLASVGFDYKPTSFFSLYLSPITGKFTFVSEQRIADLGSFGVSPAQRDTNDNPIPGTGQRFRSEMGTYVNLMFNRTIMENVNLRTRLDLFTNFKTPKLTDINWEILLNFKVNKYISANINTHLIYDDDIDIFPETPIRQPRIQFKHVLGIGLSYRFGQNP
jgi:hypothetical protein